jgi:hypothetical protein
MHVRHVLDALEARVAGAGHSGSCGSGTGSLRDTTVAVRQDVTLACAEAVIASTALSGARRVRTRDPDKRLLGL